MTQLASDAPKTKCGLSLLSTRCNAQRNVVTRHVVRRGVSLLATSRELFLGVLKRCRDKTCDVPSEDTRLSVRSKRCRDETVDNTQCRHKRRATQHAPKRLATWQIQGESVKVTPAHLLHDSRDTVDYSKDSSCPRICRALCLVVAVGRVET